MAASYIHRTNSSGSGTTATVSMWVKQNQVTADGGLFQFYTDSSNYVSGYSNPTVKFRTYISDSYGQGDKASVIENQDPGAWYHYVFVFDTTNETPGDRMRLWINGVRATGDQISSDTDPSDSYSFTPLVSGIFSINQYAANSTYSDHEYSHVHYTDGYAYDASTFGEFDSTSGIWKIKTDPTVTYGTNGVFLKFEDRTNLDLDSSTNAHTMTTVGTPTPTYDNPSNNFATMNPIANDSQTFSNGSKTITWTTNNKLNLSTLGMASGKWYAECKATDINSGVSGTLIGVGTAANFMDTYLSAVNSGWGYRCQTGNIQNGAGNEAYGDTYTDGDIIGVAIDVDNGYVYMSKNGVWQDSGDPTSGASGTGAANNQPTYGAVLSGTQFFGCSSYDTDVLSWNFGDGYYATTSTGTTEADDAGIGQFKYDVPTGFYALCTKNMKEYG